MDRKSVRRISVRVPCNALQILVCVVLLPLLSIIVIKATIRIDLVLAGRGMRHESKTVSGLRARFSQRIGPELECGQDIAVKLLVGALIDVTIGNDGFIPFSNLAEPFPPRPGSDGSVRSARTEP